MRTQHSLPLAHVLIANILGKSHAYLSVPGIFSSIKRNNDAFSQSSLLKKDKKKVIFFCKVYKEPKTHVLGNDAKGTAFSQPYLWHPYKGLCLIFITLQGLGGGQKNVPFHRWERQGLEGQCLTQFRHLVYPRETRPGQNSTPFLLSFPAMMHTPSEDTSRRFI